MLEAAIVALASIRSTEIVRPGGPTLSSRTQPESPVVRTPAMTATNWPEPSRTGTKNTCARLPPISRAGDTAGRPRRAAAAASGIAVIVANSVSAAAPSAATTDPSSAMSATRSNTLARSRTAWSACASGCGSPSAGANPGEALTLDSVSMASRTACSACPAVDLHERSPAGQQLLHQSVEARQRDPAEDPNRQERPNPDEHHHPCADAKCAARVGRRRGHRS